MKPRYLFVLLCAGYIGCAQAEIYKYVDADGHVTYSSTPMKGAKKLNLEALPSLPSPSPSTTRARSSETNTPADFPRVDSNTQKNRDDTRRKILGDELAAEEKLLAEARQNLIDGEGNPETYRGKDGKIYRNVARYDEKIKNLQDEVKLHEKNIDALKTEIANLK
jgi:hypothetical protein